MTEEVRHDKQMDMSAAIDEYVDALDEGNIFTTLTFVDRENKIRLKMWMEQDISKENQIYVIESNDLQLGVYKAVTKDHALNMYARDAGYKNYKQLRQDHGGAVATKAFTTEAFNRLYVMSEIPLNRDTLDKIIRLEDLQFSKAIYIGYNPNLAKKWDLNYSYEYYIKEK